MGKIITFYSYKGGVGRSMLLANIGVLLCQWGYNVLMVDWDLEAPGLGGFFTNRYDNEAPNNQGLIDILYSIITNDSPIRWQETVKHISFDNYPGQLDLLSAGNQNDQYFSKVRDFDHHDFYENYNGGFILEELRNGWKSAYDYILIDSRTGMTDTAGICTIQMPDIVVLVFTATNQSLDGIINVGKKINPGLQDLPIQRSKITIFPIPSRFDTQTEFKISQDWLNIFSKKLKIFYRDWLPLLPDFEIEVTEKQVKELLEIIKIPYIPYFSFGEKLPIIEQGYNDPASIGYIYQNIAALLANNFNDSEKLINEREIYLAKSISYKLQENIDIFISHSINDADYALDIVSFLEVNNLKCWIAPRDIKPGQTWAAEIINAIEKSKIFLIIFGDNSEMSNSLSREIDVAYKSNKFLIGYRREVIKIPKSILYHLSDMDIINDVSNNSEVSHNALLVKILSKLDESKTATDRRHIPDNIRKLLENVFWDVNYDSMYHNQQGFPENIDDAIKWLEQVAQQERNTFCMYILGLIYKSDEIDFRNYQDALVWFTRASENNYAPALFEIGTLYMEGLGVEQDLSKSLKYFQSAANYGNVEAKAKLKEEPFINHNL